jgi:hypothetical protein
MDAGGFVHYDASAARIGEFDGQRRELMSVNAAPKPARKSQKLTVWQREPRFLLLLPSTKLHIAARKNNERYSQNNYAPPAIRQSSRHSETHGMVKHAPREGGR